MLFVIFYNLCYFAIGENWFKGNITYTFIIQLVESLNKITIEMAMAIKFEICVGHITAEITDMTVETANPSDLNTIR